MAKLTNNLVTKIQPYTKFFYSLGQCPYATLFVFKKQPKLHKLLTNLPQILYWTLFIGLFITGILYENSHKKNPGKPSNVLFYIYYIMEFTVNSIIYFQCIFNTSALKDAIREFKEVTDMFQTSFGHQIDFNKYFIRIWKKILLIGFAFLVKTIIFMFPPKVRAKKYFSSFQLDILQSTIMIAIIQSLFYIDLLNFFLKNLNSIIENDADSKQYTNREKQQTYLKNIKIIHYRLWRIAQQINRFFGWGLIAIILRNFLDSSFAIYWTFMIIKKNPKYPLIKMIRMCDSLQLYLIINLCK